MKEKLSQGKTLKGFSKKMDTKLDSKFSVCLCVHLILRQFRSRHFLRKSVELDYMTMSILLLLLCLLKQ